MYDDYLGILKYPILLLLSFLLSSPYNRILLLSFHFLLLLSLSLLS